MFTRSTRTEARSASADEDARARLAATAPEMARMLLAMEWLWDDHRAAAVCVWCQHSPLHGHTEDCKWLALMRKAGVRE